jgi:transcriptional regulator with XRE-family HTH domain
VRKPLGEVIKNAREAVRVSQRDLARLADMPTGQISKIETGISPNPSFLTVARIAESLKISLDVIAAQCASGNVATIQSTLEASERKRLIVLREIETAVREGKKTTARLEALLEKKPAPGNKQGKRKKPS